MVWLLNSTQLEASLMQCTINDSLPAPIMQRLAKPAHTHVSYLLTCESTAYGLTVFTPHFLYATPSQ